MPFYVTRWGADWKSGDKTVIRASRNRFNVTPCSIEFWKWGLRYEPANTYSEHLALCVGGMLVCFLGNVHLTSIYGFWNVGSLVLLALLGTFWALGYWFIACRDREDTRGI
jgi:hypothetical protein